MHTEMWSETLKERDQLHILFNVEIWKRIWSWSVNLNGLGRKQPWCMSKYCHIIRLAWLKETKNVNWGKRGRDRDLKLGPPDWKSVAAAKSLGPLGRDNGRIIIKMYLKQDVKCELDWTGSAQGSVASCCEVKLLNRNRPLAYTLKEDLHFTKYTSLSAPFFGTKMFSYNTQGNKRKTLLGGDVTQWGHFPLLNVTEFSFFFFFFPYIKDNAHHSNPRSIDELKTNIIVEITPITLQAVSANMRLSPLYMQHAGAHFQNFL